MPYRQQQATENARAKLIRKHKAADSRSALHSRPLLALLVAHPFPAHMQDTDRQLVVCIPGLCLCMVLCELHLVFVTNSTTPGHTFSCSSCWWHCCCFHVKWLACHGFLQLQPVLPPLVVPDLCIINIPCKLPPSE
eukprot:GHRR01003665.1.p1 GENE.GHRR01003665.1~~GHRR01003665.1.p1  ORF type:complete len:136 (-),score=29.21 GHRR01003665.1:526-933(-)